MSTSYKKDKALLVVSVLSGRKLQGTDDNGKSDPYAVVMYDDQKEKTAYKSKTTAPEWNEDFTFKIAGDENMEKATVRVQVFDHDFVGKDDYLGEALITLESAVIPYQKTTQWYPLNQGKGGEVQIGLLWRPTLILTIEEARDLSAADSNGLSDPYVKVECKDNKFEDKTPHISKTLNPVYSKDNVFHIPPMIDHNSVIVCTVFDHDAFGKDDSLGFMEVSTAQVAFAGESDLWLPINRGKGAIRIKTLWVPELPLKKGLSSQSKKK